MKLEYKWSRLESFTALELYEILKAREAVFIVEQNCPYHDTDVFRLFLQHKLHLIKRKFKFSRIV